MFVRGEKMVDVRQDHDRWFKELISTFFEEFILAFLPDVFEHLDFQHLSFLHQEVYTDVLKRTKGMVDIIAETKLKGEDSLIIVHVEPQSTYDKSFHERMFFYFSRLYEKYGRPIVPIAIFSYDQPREEKEVLTLHFPFKKVLTFEYFIIELKKKNWRDFIRQPNPVALALLGKMGYDQSERVRMKYEFLRMLLKLELDPARQHLVAGIFDNYMSLNSEETIELQQLLNQSPKDEVIQLAELMTSWEKKGFEKGIQNGLENVVKQMLVNGFSISDICKATGLTDAEIQEIKQNSK